MSLQKNVTGQKWTVFAFTLATGAPAAGDAANITGDLRIDGALNAIDDINPTDLGDGYYEFNLSQAETNGDHLVMIPDSSTAGIQVIGVPGSVWTTTSQAGIVDVQSRLPSALIAGRMATASAYEQGGIWFNPDAANAGTVPYTDGTATNPVSTLDAVSSLSASLGLKRVIFSPKAQVTLTAAFEDYYIQGSGGNVNMGGQSINGSVFDQCALTGSSDGIAPTSTPVILNAFFISAQLGPHISKRNGVLGNTVFTNPGTYVWDSCFSSVAGGVAPIVTFPAGVVDFNLRHYSGGIEFAGMTADTTVSFEGAGQIIIGASCTGGEIHVRGAIGPVTDNSGGAVTIIEYARLAHDTIQSSVADALTADAEIDTIKAGVAAIEVDTQDIQSRLPSALIAGRMSADMQALAGDTTSATNLSASASSIMVATSTGGTTTTITTTGITEPTADHLNGRVVIFTSGALKYQATAIEDYSFAGGTATLTVTAMTEAPTTEEFVVV